MIRNYNGKVNRSMLRDLKKICDIIDEARDKLMDGIGKGQKMGVYTNIDSFTGCPDELSDIVELNNEEMVEKYLKEEALERVLRYLEITKPESDYLLDEVVTFINDNGTYPSKDVMRELENKAEAKRVANLPPETDREMTEEDIIIEILELAEEIMEARRENNPSDIFTPVEPYPEKLYLSNDVFSGNILHECYYGYKDYRDYHCALKPKNMDIYCHYIDIHYTSYNDSAEVLAKSYNDEESPDKVKVKYIILIHKEMVRLAEEEGIEFISEIEYEKFE